MAVAVMDRVAVGNRLSMSLVTEAGISYRVIVDRPGILEDAVATIIDPAGNVMDVPYGILAALDFEADEWDSGATEDEEDGCAVHILGM